MLYPANQVRFIDGFRTSAKITYQSVTHARCVLCGAMVNGDQKEALEWNKELRRHNFSKRFLRRTSSYLIPWRIAMEGIIY